MKKHLLLIGTCYLICTTASAQDSSPDNSFDTDGKLVVTISNGVYSPVNLPRTVLIQPDGKIVTCASVANGTSYDVAIFRFNSDGSPDNSFDGDGSTLLNISGNDYVFRLARQPDGKIIAAGYYDNGTAQDIFLLRYNSNGTPDNSFDGDGIVIKDVANGFNFAFALALQPDGKIIAGGIDVNGPAGNATLYRFNSDGTPDNSFSGDGMASLTGLPNRTYINDIELQTDGKILASCINEYQTGPTFLRGLVARFNSDGTIDNSFSSDGWTAIGPFDDPFVDVRPYAITTQQDGKILVAGNSNNGGSNSLLLARLDDDGSFDNSFSGGDGTDGYLLLSNGIGLLLFDVLQQSDGKILAAGSNGIGNFYLHKFNANGSNDISFNGTGWREYDCSLSGQETAQGMALYNNGRILLTGIAQATSVSPYDLALIRINNSGHIVLPILLSRFNAYRQQNTAVLEWATGSEINNRGFEIQRSHNGRDYSTLAFVNGAGNSQTENYYRYIDAMPAKGINLYRLQQVDIDGRTSTSAVRKIDFGNLFDILLYPNPVKNNLQVQLSKTIRSVELINESGQLMWKKEKDLPVLLSIPVLQLPNGVYTLVAMDQEGRRQSQRFVK
jgi:uncharacterized delta-60 repeat protein